MSSQSLEGFLARIYVDEQARAKFISNPRREALKAGLKEVECLALETIDLPGLELAARSFARKRQQKKRIVTAKILQRLRSGCFLGRRT